MTSGSSIRTIPPQAGHVHRAPPCTRPRRGSLRCANRLSCRFVDVDPDQIAWSDLEQPQAGPKGGGQDARSNTRFRRCAQVIAARRSAGVGSSKSAVVACWPPLPRLARVTRARCLLFGAKTP